MQQKDEATRVGRDNSSPQGGKKPYTTPQLFRVELDQEQAILSACSLTTSSAANGGNRSCRGFGLGQCKRFRRRNGDSGPRLS